MLTLVDLPGRDPQRPATPIDPKGVPPVPVDRPALKSRCGWTRLAREAQPLMPGRARARTRTRAREAPGGYSAESRFAGGASGIGSMPKCSSISSSGACQTKYMRFARELVQPNEFSGGPFI